MITYPLQNPEDDPILKDFLAVFANARIKTVAIVPTVKDLTLHAIREMENPFPALQKALFKASQTKELEPLRSLTRYNLPLPRAAVEELVQPYHDIVSKIEEELRSELEIRCLYGEQPRMGTVAAPVAQGVFSTYRFIKYENPRHISFFKLEDAATGTIEEAIARQHNPRDDAAYGVIPVASMTVRRSMDKTILPFFAYHLLCAFNMVLPRRHIPMG